MVIRIFQVDAFTDRPFAGNPAAVCLLTRPAPECWMQQVAAEMNLSETAFLVAEGDGYRLRWFTPAVESDLCGHATLATTHALRSDDRIAGAVRYHTRSGVLIAHPNDDDTITLDFPAAPLTEVPIPEGLVEALGVKPEATYRTGPLRDLLTVLSDEAAVRAVAPDIAAVEALTRRDNIRGVTVTAPATEYDFVSRFFAPGDGIPEDPVTGSAHTAIAPYWAGRLGRDELTGLQASARTGVLRLAVRGDRVHITGSAVTVVDGTLLSEP